MASCDLYDHASFYEKIVSYRYKENTSLWPVCRLMFAKSEGGDRERVRER